MSSPRVTVHAWAAPAPGSAPALLPALARGVLVTPCEQAHLVSAAPLGFLFPGSGSGPLVCRECPILLLYQLMDRPATGTSPGWRCFIRGAEQWASVAQISQDLPFLKSPSRAFMFSSSCLPSRPTVPAPSTPGSPSWACFLRNHHRLAASLASWSALGGGPQAFLSRPLCL